VPDLGKTQGAAVVLEMRDRSFSSLTGIDLLRQIADKIQETGNVLLLADVDLDQRRALERAG
jgi:hypothetical protein